LTFTALETGEALFEGLDAHGGWQATKPIWLLVIEKGSSR